jgi:hypothetical protein
MNVLTITVCKVGLHVLISRVKIYLVQTVRYTHMYIRHNRVQFHFQTELNSDIILIFVV